MPTYFFDTSAFAKLYHWEIGSEVVERLFLASPGSILISRLALVEIESVLANKVRTKVLNVSGQSLARRRLQADLSQGRVGVGPPIEEHHYRSARRLVMRHGVGLGLRSLDAIQLAVALELKEACLVRVRGWEQNLIAASLLAFRIVFAGLIPGRYVIAVFSVDLVDIFQIFLTLTMAWVLFRRVWRTWVERQGLSAEFEAAREMQESLVQLPPVLPGFTVESAYRPASQVGGDFYRIFPADEGAILVVVGDVSGKGLKAAMTVSVLVGAMEAIRTRMPGEFLEEFNHVAKGYMHSGFATCCAVLIHASGEAIIANAGHLAPYADGHEVEVEAGLPLGIADGVEYPESVTRGERFTFVSDGVMEAGNPQGELFGFDRTSQISGRSAQEISDAAKAWGQNDDITVTVRRSLDPYINPSQSIPANPARRRPPV